MNPRDLLAQPIWEAAELGHPIPASPHAVSVALPRWEDVVGYEEKRPEVIARLNTGYPRFVIHAKVQELARQLSPAPACLPFPSRRAAEAAVAFIRQQSGEPAQITAWNQALGVGTTPAGAKALTAFWQHTGLIVASREAEDRLAGRPDVPHAPEIRQGLRRQLAAWYGCAESDVFLAPSGMAAHYAALQAVMARRPGLPTVQLGFPYVDTLKLQQKVGHGGILLHDLERVGPDLDATWERTPFAACFGEIPGNPLLGSVNVRETGPWLRARGVPLVVDDVVATPANVDLTPHADLIATSLTKYVVGTGDAMGGALICSPRSPLHDELVAIIRCQHEELLWGTEAEVLAAGARDFPERMVRHNRGGLLIAERLRAHPAIERVWYPKWEHPEAYDAVRRPEGGWGSLLTFLPRHAAQTAAAVYDRLEVCKGPSLGTLFTLACPFTLLAHYTELEWAEACGVPRHLIRLSVGLEDPEELWQRIETALQPATPAGA